MKRPVDTAALWTGKPTPAASAVHSALDKPLPTRLPPGLSTVPTGTTTTRAQYISHFREKERPASQPSTTAPRQVVSGTSPVPLTTWLP